MDHINTYGGKITGNILRILCCVNIKIQPRPPHLESQHKMFQKQKTKKKIRDFIAIRQHLCLTRPILFLSAVFVPLY